MLKRSKQMVSEGPVDHDEEVRAIVDVLDLLVQQVQLLAERVALLERLEER
jgi:hypothetical protein